MHYFCDYFVLVVAVFPSLLNSFEMSTVGSNSFLWHRGSRLAHSTSGKSSIPTDGLTISKSFINKLRRITRQSKAFFGCVFGGLHEASVMPPRLSFLALTSLWSGTLFCFLQWCCNAPVLVPPYHDAHISKGPKHSPNISKQRRLRQLQCSSPLIVIVLCNCFSCFQVILQLFSGGFTVSFLRSLWSDMHCKRIKLNSI